MAVHLPTGGTLWGWVGFSLARPRCAAVPVWERGRVGRKSCTPGLSAEKPHAAGTFDLPWCFKIKSIVFLSINFNRV